MHVQVYVISIHDTVQGVIIIVHSMEPAIVHIYHHKLKHQEKQYNKPHLHTTPTYFIAVSANQFLECFLKVSDDTMLRNCDLILTEQWFCSQSCHMSRDLNSTFKTSAIGSALTTTTVISRTFLAGRGRDRYINGSNIRDTWGEQRSVNAVEEENRWGVPKPCYNVDRQVWTWVDPGNTSLSRTGFVGDTSAMSPLQHPERGTRIVNTSTHTHTTHTHLHTHTHTHTRTPHTHTLYHLSLLLWCPCQHTVSSSPNSSPRVAHLTRMPVAHGSLAEHTLKIEVHGVQS